MRVLKHRWRLSILALSRWCLSRSFATGAFSACPRQADGHQSSQGDDAQVRTEETSGQQPGAADAKQARSLPRARWWLALAVLHVALLCLYFWARTTDLPIRLSRHGGSWTIQVADEEPATFTTGPLRFDSASLWVNEDTSFTESWNHGGWSELYIAAGTESLYHDKLRQFAGKDWKMNWRRELVATRWPGTRRGVAPAEAAIQLAGDFQLRAVARRTRLCRLALHQREPPAKLAVSVRALNGDYECRLETGGKTSRLCGGKVRPTVRRYAKELTWKCLSVYFSALVLTGFVFVFGAVLRCVFAHKRKRRGEETAATPSAGAAPPARWGRLAAVLVIVAVAVTGTAFALVLTYVYAERRLQLLRRALEEARADFGPVLFVVFLAIVFGAVSSLFLRLLTTLATAGAGRRGGQIPPDWLTVLLICLSTFLMTAGGAKYVMREVPRVQDSVAYLNQAKMLAAGRLWVPIPKIPEPFEFQFMTIDRATGRWFCQYTPGYPAVLATGVWLGRPWLVSPIMAALTAWILYLTGRMIYGRAAGLLSAALAMVSPWLLFMSSSLMSHATALFFTTLFFYLAVRSVRGGHWAWALGAGAALGVEMLARPMSAAAVALGVSFGLTYISSESRRAGRWSHPMIISLAVGAIVLTLYALQWPLVKGGAVLAAALGVCYLLLLRRRRKIWGRVALIAAGLGFFAVLLLAYNWAMTGNPLLTPRGREGLGLELLSGRGFSLSKWSHITETNLSMLMAQLFGWPAFSLAFAAAVLIWGRQKESWVLASVCVAMVIGYSGINYLFHLFGPRFWYEGLFAVLLLSGAGLVAMGRTGARAMEALRGRARGPVPPQPWIAAGCCVIAVLVLYNVKSFAPVFAPRLDGYNGISGVDKRVIEEAKLRNAIVFAQIKNKSDWQDYGRVMWMNHPILERGAIIVAKDLGERHNTALAAAYPGRQLYRLTREAQPRLEPLRYDVEDR